MKKLAIGLLLLSGVVHADNLAVTVKNFNFTYKNPQGSGSATSFSRSGALLDEGVAVSVDKVGEVFKLSVSGAENQEFEFKDAPSFMTEAETMTVTGFNLNLADRLGLSLAQGRFDSQDDSLKLDGVNLDCNRDAAQKEVMDQLINGCLQKMTLKSSKFSSSSAEKKIVDILSHSIALAMNDGKAIDGVGVNSLDLRVNGGKYDLAADVKADISGKVKSNGNMSYDPASGKLTIKISEVKFSILNITGKVFDELRKQESDKLQVKQPYVYYTIK